MFFNIMFKNIKKGLSNGKIIRKNFNDLKKTRPPMASLSDWQLYNIEQVTNCKQETQSKNDIQNK